MKPCRKNRKLIAWLTVGALESAQERGLRAHIETCAGCRRYFEEISEVAHKLQAPEPEANIQASAYFHRRVLSALKEEDTSLNWPVPVAQWVTNWRLALPAAVAAVLMILALAIFLHPPAVAPSAITDAQSVPPAVVRKADPLPTLSNYEMVANQSLDQFDELLNRQASRNPPPAPIFQASSLLPETVTE